MVQRIFKLSERELIRMPRLTSTMSTTSSIATRIRLLETTRILTVPTSAAISGFSTPSLSTTGHFVGDGNVNAGHIDSESAADGHVLTADGSGNSAFEAPTGGGSSTFLDLTDTPAAFGTSGQVAAVNTAGDALEFVDQTGGGGGGGSTDRIVLVDAFAIGVSNSIPNLRLL